MAAPPPPSFFLRAHLGGPRGDFDEVSFSGDGSLQSANRAPRGPVLRRRCIVAPAVLAHVAASVRSSGLLDADDASWPEPGRSTGVTEVEFRLDGVHASLSTAAGVTPGDDASLASLFEVATGARALARALLAAADKEREVRV